MEGRPSSSPLKEVLPKNGLVYSEKGSLDHTMCKPKIMPIKSALTMQLEAKLTSAADTKEAED